MSSDAPLGRSLPAAPASGQWDTVPKLLIGSGRIPGPKVPDEINARFRALAENRLVAVAITSPDKRWLLVNDKWCEMIGYSREELAFVDWAEITHPDDLASDVAHFERLLSGEINDYALEKRFVRKNREILYAEISITAVRGPDGALKYVVGLGIDITQRKLAEQTLAGVSRSLIEAQEQERARIGRELHDDIAQRLGLLVVEIDLLKENPSKTPRALQDLRARINEIAKDVQSLSTDLHATKLEYLGAIPGIESWCSEFGARCGVLVNFKSDLRTPLPAGFGVYLFRVVQEALQNVVKHSGASRAEVAFAERANQVHVVISDAGRGFDPRETHNGLGLISMQERIRLLGGTVTIESAPLRGTTILIRVPIK